MRTLLPCVAAVVCAGCAETTPCCSNPTPAYALVAQEAPAAALPSLAASRILVLQSTHTDRLTEVVGVIDVHADMGGHDAALELLRARAAELGADAVLGVEFHHGHEDHGPTHLSGLAVRFLPALP